ncbi:MAG: hypothetical protein HC921_01790 [Synechococcaceae cyanobacterium SM2_3_1]|nr:hypothetical protein [Synechococcaceae cyanobacterium SM2_3_1]
MSVAWQARRLFMATVLLIAPWFTGDAIQAQVQPPSPAPTPMGQLDGTQLLTQYLEVLQQLPELPNLQFRQQVRVSGSQEFLATLDVLRRRDGSWQAWLNQGDRIRLLNSEDLKIVNQSDILELYSVYVTQPEALLTEVGFNLTASPSQYQITDVKQEGLGDTEVLRLFLEPRRDGQIRELWLDQETLLPRQALLFLSGVWGQAYVLLTFAEVDQYWLPSSARINVGYGFWTLDGLSRRTFRGTLSIQHDYQDYQVLPDGVTLQFQASRPPVDAPPQVVSAGETRITAGDVQALGPNAEGNEVFNLDLQAEGEETLLGDRITAFNLTRPATRNALTQFDTLASLGLGSDILPLYLFQFDTGSPIAPLQPLDQSPQANPRDVFEQRPPRSKTL